MTISAERRRTLATVLMIAALWLVTRRYAGIIHDARLYTMLALSHNDPHAFAGDLFTQFGSQDRFTLFSPVYAMLLGKLGTSTGHLVAALVLQAGWLAALVYLVRSVIENRATAALAVGLVVVLPGGVFFRYGEPFVTARIAAEAFGMAALGASLRGRATATAVGTLLALAVHPLTALMPAVTCAVPIVRQRLRLSIALLGAGGALLIGLAAAGIAPFDHALLRYDAEWLAIVRGRDFDAFFGDWSISHWLGTYEAFALCGIAWFGTEGAVRRLAGRVLIVGAAAFVVALIGGELMHNVLVVSLQLWRAAWLVALVGHIGLAPLILRAQPSAWHPRTTMVTLLLLTILLACARFLPIATLLVPPTTLVTVLALDAGRTGRGRLLPVVHVGCIVFAAILFAAEASQINALLPNPTEALRVGSALTLLVIAGMVAVLLFRWRDIPALGLATLALIAAVATWDHRSPWRRYIDAGVSSPTLRAALPPGPIYWEGDVTVPWLLLHRASYFSCEQGAGVLFSRPTARAYAGRATSFGNLPLLDFGDYSFCPLTPTRQPPPPASRAVVAALCRREPDLAALVLRTRVPDAIGTWWDPPVAFQPANQPLEGTFRVKRFYIYRCADFVRRGGEATANSADRVGFEPTVKLPPRRFSRPLP